MDSGKEGGAMIDFNTLSQRYFSGSEADRLLSAIEYRSHSGRPISAGESTRQFNFIIRGDGMLEFSRRGDFMERGDALPGVWQSRCQPSDLSAVWDRLGDLGSDSFPSRMADPGDPHSRITAYFPHTAASLSWGPRDHSRPAPGTAFMEALNPLLIRTSQGIPVWSVEMRCLAVEVSARGLEVEIELLNHGSESIGFLLPALSEGGGFRLRHAPFRETPPDVTPLPISWAWENLVLPGQIGDSLWQLAPGAPLKIRLQAESRPERGRTFHGKLEYEQAAYLDRFTGYPVLSGACFTPAFKFAS